MNASPTPHSGQKKVACYRRVFNISPIRRAARPQAVPVLPSTVTPVQPFKESQSSFSASCVSLPLQSNVIPSLRMLDLFSGSGSVASFFQENGYETLTVDYDPVYHPNILACSVCDAFHPSRHDTAASKL